MSAFSALIVVMFASLGPSIIVAIIGVQIMLAIGRHPSQASRIFLGKFLILIVTEALSIALFIIIYNMFALRKPSYF